MAIKKAAIMWAALLLPLPSLAQPALGVWQTQNGDGHVHIQPCGADRLCGTLVWVDANQTQNLNDINNPNPAFRERSLIGIQILSNLPLTNSDGDVGTIYNPHSGKSFDATISLMNSDTLRVRGCLGPVCVNRTWHRVLQ